MSTGLLIVGIALVLAFAALLWTGEWRQLLRVFAIKPTKMTVTKLNLCVEQPEDIDRINSLLESFSTGFNTMLSAPSIEKSIESCDANSPLFQPFAHEGMAMGFVPRRLLRYCPEAFENQIVKPRPQFRYLYYVGLGFWAGMGRYTPRALTLMASKLDPLHRFLCYDGYGFKCAFFDHPNDPTVFRRLDKLPDYARNAAYQGVGRGLWFRYMSRPSELNTQIEKLGTHAVDAAAGVGLAATFVNPDRFHIAIELGLKMPKPWQPHYHVGMCFALKARAIGDVEWFESTIDQLDDPVREAVLASIRECDRIELLVRDDLEPNKYCRWRELVSNWLIENIEFPMASIKVTQRTGAPKFSTAAQQHP